MGCLTPGELLFQIVSTATATERRLSVVVASHNARATVGRCLESLENQRPSGIRQIILVDKSSDGTAEWVRQHFPSIEVLQKTGDVLVPELWAEGVMRSREPIVALTTANMAAEPNWASAILDCYARGEWAGVGGVILPAAGLNPLDAAIYWLRYHRYAGSPEATVVSDIPGDNGSYRCSRLDSYRERIQRDGFWEYEINQSLIKGGARLFSTPGAVVRYIGGESFLDFARQRLMHGCRFGAKRVEHLHGPRRWMLLIAWPLTPFAFLARIVRGAVQAGGAMSLLKSSPPLVVLLMCWSIGEFYGYLVGARRD